MSDPRDPEEMARRYTRVRAFIETTPAEECVPDAVVEETFLLARVADQMAREEEEHAPDIVHEVRDFLLAHKLPTTLKERNGRYTGARLDDNNDSSED